MTDEEGKFWLTDRIQKIQQIINQYGEENFYISFSGGKDSVVLHHLIDKAIPENKIPRVYANTGIEFNDIIKFVKSLAENDERIQIIKPSTPIKQMLEKEGYPFKSKIHSKKVDVYQRCGMTRTVNVYLGKEPTKNGVILTGENRCPKMLEYQFTPEFDLRVSLKCCDRLKKDPLHEWQKQNSKPYPIIGIMPDEGGQRTSAQCLAFNGGKLKAFQPLVPVTKEWEDWFIESEGIELCRLYNPPFNFKRTGCKGCPYNLRVQEELDTLDQYLPNEKKQCEIIWKPVYEEYRRLGYRNMRPLEDGRQMTVTEFLEQE